MFQKYLRVKLSQNLLRITNYFRNLIYVFSYKKKSIKYNNDKPTETNDGLSVV